ncbi:MAG TPA: homoserine O-succinyltransferase [Gemmatimonadaceae bacterium]|jgi:homoserine O-acetyltransferase|nr:homoserine O-succinyltransferase [Gemmatimonadaceae bacterium]
MTATIELLERAPDAEIDRSHQPRNSSTTRDSKFEIIGKRGAPVVVVLGGISASKHIASSPSDSTTGWWEDVVGRDKPVDTDQFRVLGIDYAPDDTGPDAVTTADQADRVAATLDHLGVRKAHAVIGASYGGMVALAFGARHGDRAGRLIVISAAHRSDPLSTGLRHLQRRVIELGSATGREHDAIAIARGIAMTTYLTTEHLAERIAPDDSSDSSAIEARIGNFLRTSGEQFADRWTPERYTALSLSLDLHDVIPEAIQIPTCVIAVSSDRLVPVEHCRELARRLGGPAQIVELDSRFGHDAFLGDACRIAPFIAELLKIDTGGVVR